MEFIKMDSIFRKAPKASCGTETARICMPTWRNFARRTWRCGFYEAEDVLLEIDDVDLIPLDMAWGARIDEYWLRTPLYYDVSRKFIFANPGLKKIRLNRTYDVFVAALKTLWDLPYINAIEQWRDYCNVSICWIDELWVSSIADYKYWLHALSQFDYVFVGLHGTASALSQAIGQPCHWLPGGVDALRFSPFPDPPPRVIDVYSIGRRYDGIHSKLLTEAGKSHFFYVHDTHANIANTDVCDYGQHRNMFANFAKRSRFFVVAAAKMDSPEEVQGQVEIGHRYFEGAAAGTIMIGDAPDCESYRELFGWPEAVLRVHPDGSNIRTVLAEAGSDPERMAAISRRNTREALLRHDWVYRWNEMFRVAGIQPSPHKEARERLLIEMADLAASAGTNVTGTA